MRIASILVLFVSIPSFADASPSAKRDAALKAINSCIQRNEVSNGECRKLNANVETLVEIYKQGDKSVLPTLFRFTYLTDFYGEALLGDPDGFLSALNQLQEKDQKAVAAGIAGPTSIAKKPVFVPFLTQDIAWDSVSIPLWPSDGTLVVWPPPKHLDDEHLKIFAERWGRLREGRWSGQPLYK